MQKSARETHERRALNIVWSAAGAYGFQPDFLAFHRDGTPDIYLNSIVGFAHRYYDAEKLAAYVRQLDQSLLHETFADILWLGIEQAAYQREVAVRPVLRDLRLAHARQFLLDDIDESMQSLMLRNEIIHTLKAGRCHEILGEPMVLHNPWDRRLYAALDYPAELTTDEIIERTEAILRRFFVFRFAAGRRTSWHIVLGSRVSAWLRRLLPHEEGAAMRRLGSSGKMVPDSAAPLGSSGGSADDMTRIRQAFGPPLLAEAERARIEQELCCGPHRGARLYYAKGQNSQAGTANRKSWQEQQVRYRLAMRRLRERLKSCLAVYRQPLEVRGHKGRLAPGRVWRARYLQDSRVFMTWQERVQADFDVTLLLDASESRRGQQELIAAQAYAIVESLCACAIPVQVVSFCSLHGVTVLCQLKAFADTETAGVFAYAAGGWNRDGLALQAAARLLRPESGRQQLLLVLTDANPSDELGVPLASGLITAGYREQTAVADTAAAAKTLRQRGIRVIGLVNSVVPGETVTSVARAIYGQDTACVTRIEELADKVGRLMERHIQQSYS